MSDSYAKQVFIELVESVPQVEFFDFAIEEKEELLTSTNEFFKLLEEANDIFNKTFNISDRDKLIFVEDIPSELVQRLNNESTSTNISAQTLRDIRLITYTAKEYPGSPGAHKPGHPTIPNIKHKLAEVYKDSKYTDYSIIRYKKEIEAEISFQVWGQHYQDIRNRSKLLREVIDNSAWYFKKKGLKEIIWTGSFEEAEWDRQQIVKNKTEKYIITFNEIKEVREKNIEQIVVQFGLSK